MENTALFWLCLCCESIQNFIRSSITATSELFLWLFLYQPFPIVLRFYRIFLGVNRDIRGGSDLSQIASTASGRINISKALGCGEVRESRLLLLLNDHISYCSAVSFSFSSLHIISNTTNAEYLKDGFFC